MKKLPIGIQTFSKIIENNLLYVDKTELIYKLINSGDYFFLSRPRRFGKSLLVSTLKEIFEGNKESFKGLYIYDKIEWIKYPVLHIDFTLITYSESKEVFKNSLKEVLFKRAEEYDISIKGEQLRSLFEDLIKKLSKKNKVVILIDEYDKPIIDHITPLTSPLDKGENGGLASKNREVLREFYSVLKGVDKYIKFVFITGVSKFSKVSIFSGLNNLEDITLDERFANIAGIKQEEMEKYFDEHIEALKNKENISKEKLLEKIKRWYNGYSWNGTDKLYNPVSILNLFSSKRFSNFWFATGTPTFLIKLIKESKTEITDKKYYEKYLNPPSAPLNKGGMGGFKEIILLAVGFVDKAIQFYKRDILLNN